MVFMFDFRRIRGRAGMMSIGGFEWHASEDWVWGYIYLGDIHVDVSCGNLIFISTSFFNLGGVNGIIR